MKTNGPHNGLDEYKSVGVQTGVEEANPHRLTQMLMDGAMGRISAALGHMERKEAAEKGQNISKAITIIEGLQASLDMDGGNDIAHNLDSLYDYMVRNLLTANSQDNAALLDEVHNLMGQVRDAWAKIGDQGAASAKDVMPRMPEPN